MVTPRVTPSTTITNDRQVAGLHADEAKPTFATVAGCPGLRIKIQTGRKGTARIFLYRYRAPDGSLRQATIGAYDPPDFTLKDARARWRELRGIRETHGYVKEVVEKARADNITAIEAAKTDRGVTAYTVTKLADEFIEHQSAQIKTWKETDRNLKAYVLPHIGETPAGAVRRRDLVAILDDLTAKGNTVTSNRVLAAVRAMYNWAIQREKLEVNPCTAIKPRKEQSRERMLGDVELRRLFANMPDSPLTTDERDLLEFILLTGCRLSEAAQARLAEFDIDAALWVLPAARSKNGRAHRLPLSDQALTLLERRRGTTPFLFAMDDRRPMRADHIHTPLREAMPVLKVLPFTPHDLRRSAASGLAALGAPRDIVRRVLNHTDATVTARYDKHDHTLEMRRWLQVWAGHLDVLRGVTKASKKRGVRA